jgi:L-cysteine:1D-myo-inositol 2-amino-2-deoxy-alpha-D-glucopyranoside ligase
MVYMDGEKMSKSLGNMVFARDLIESHGADAVRVYVSSCHYRSELHWNNEAFLAAARTSEQLREAVYLQSGTGSPYDPVGFHERFQDRLDDDLDTPGALGVLTELAESIRLAVSRNEDARSAQHLARELGDILGLAFRNPPDSSVKDSIPA